MSYDLKPGLKKYFSMIEEDRPWTAFVRDFAKGYFDIFRSLFVVGALKFISEKSESTLLAHTYDTSRIILLLLILSYISPWYVHLFKHFGWGKVGEVFDLILNVFVALVLFAIALHLVNSAVEALAKSRI
jgi:cytochrome c oxidase subunit IV